jgi:hypothetical protein
MNRKRAAFSICLVATIGRNFPGNLFKLWWANRARVALLLYKSKSSENDGALVSYGVRAVHHYSAFTTINLLLWIWLCSWLPLWFHQRYICLMCRYAISALWDPLGSVMVFNLALLALLPEWLRGCRTEADIERSRFASVNAYTGDRLHG